MSRTTQLLKVPKVAKTIVPTFSDDQLHRFFRAIDLKSKNGVRDYCIALTFLDTGIRLSELPSLTISNLDLKRGHFKVMGKGWKERIVPIGARVHKTFWKYIHHHRPEPAHPSVQTVFLSQRGYALSARVRTSLQIPERNYQIGKLFLSGL